MKGRILVKFTAGILFTSFLLCSSVWAAQLDQSQVLSDGGVAFWSDKAIVQTFTPSITGYLDTLSLELGASPRTFADPIPIHIAITEWDGSSPQTLLGQIDISLTATQTYSWMDFDFSSQGVSLSAETMYAILLTNDLFYYDVPDPYRNTGIAVQWVDNPYDRGGLWNRHAGVWIPWTSVETDAVFKTWMSSTPVPEPATMLLFGSGLIGLAGVRRKFRKR